MSPNNNNNSNDKIDWNNVLKKEVIGIGGLDMGEVHEVGDTYFTTQKGLLHKKRYHIPKSIAESFDGDTLTVRISESNLSGFEEEVDGQKFEGYSSFKSSDMSKELESKIPVMAENLEITKSIAEDKVDIIKEPILETKTVEIELMRETITIERRSVIDNSTVTSNSGNNSSNTDNLTLSSSSSLEEPVESRTEISIPLKREEPVIIKKPYVKEEIIVKKKPISETKTITEDITHENVKYDNKLNKENDSKNIKKMDGK